MCGELVHAIASLDNTGKHERWQLQRKTSRLDSNHLLMD